MSARATRTTVAVALAWIAIGCSEGGAPSTPPSPTASTGSAPTLPPPPAEPEPRDLVAEGRDAYLGNCIACHNPDPKLEGALGPPVWGASEELLEARIMRAEYPPGYTPKSTTTSMIAMPFLERKIAVIAAYLEDEG